MRVLRWGWVPAYARTTGGGGRPLGASLRGAEEGMGPRIREDNGGGEFPLPSSRGWLSVCGGTGMGPRIRRVHEGRLSAGGRGWVPAAARTTGGGGRPLGASLRGAEEGMGPRIREDNGSGGVGSRIPSARGETGSLWGDGSPHTRGQRVGAWGRGTGGSRTAPTEGEYCRALGSPPSPVFTRAGSNLPPSRGKGFVGDERAIFIVMTCGGAPRCVRKDSREGVVVWVVQLWHSESVR